MKVYILTEHFEVEGNQVQGVYTSYDKAIEDRDLYIRERYDDHDHEVDWSWICEDLANFEILEMEVQ